jgi:pimeloyl-ACP methyl ester carboxylesterase
MTQTVTVRNSRFTVDISSESGVPVLMLHGIPGWRGTWHAAGQLLSNGYRVVIPDLPGFGESTAMVTDGHAAEHAAAMLEMLDRLDITDVHVCGFDFGGPVAIWMYRLAPQRINTLTLLATNTFTDTPIPLTLRIARVRYLGEAAFRLLMGKSGLTMMWWQAVKRREAFPLSRYRSALRFGTGLRSTRKIFVNSLRHLDTLYRPIEETLGSIRVPTLVVWGDSDPFFPIEIGRRTAAAIPHATFLPLRDCGHFVPEEQPHAVADAIATLLRTTIPSPTAAAS